MNYYGEIKHADYKKVKYGTSSGAFLSNDHLINYFSVTTGFRGVGMSGFGRIRGFEGFKELSNTKTIIGKDIIHFLNFICYFREKISQINIEYIESLWYDFSLK